MVEHLATDRRQQIDVDSGTRITGAVAECTSGLQVSTHEGVTYLATSSVVHMTPAPEKGTDGFWQRVDGEVDAGYSLTGGNSETSQTTLSLNAAYRTASYKLEVDLSSLSTSDTQSPTTGWQTGSARLDLFLGIRTFAFALAGLERDQRELLNLRANFGGGLGWKLLTSERGTVSLLAGVNAMKEDFRGTEPAGVSPGGRSGEALIGLNVQSVALGPFRASTKIAVNPNVVELGRYRLALESGLRLPVIGRLIWNIRFFDRFDNSPPRKVRRNDYGLISGFGVSF